MTKTVIVLGNGFDMSLGLPTSYSSLVKSKFFVHEIEKGNDLAIYLSNESLLSNRWIGIENNLIQYTKNNPDFDKFYSDYIAVKEAIKQYYSDVDNNHCCKPSIGSDIVIKRYGQCVSEYNQSRRDELLIINFNYTNSVNRILSAFYGRRSQKILKVLDDIQSILNAFTGEDHRKVFDHIREVHPHGTTSTDIIFGVNDYDDVGDYIFLKKSATETYQPGFNFEDLNSANEIIFYGHSLGRADHHYFKELFAQQSRKNVLSKILRFYYYGENDRLKLMKELDKLTEMQLAAFRMNNDIFFTDCSSTNYQRIVYPF